MTTLPVSEVDEPITIEEYDPTWPEAFARESARVLHALGSAVAGIEHFGSTAVPGMAGKPVVDLLVGVRRYEGAPEVAASLEVLGYQSFGEVFFAGRHYLRRRGELNFNAAVTEVGGEFWSTQLAVRDYLRAHPEEAARYAEEKRRAYAKGARLFSTYSQAKGPYLAGLVSRARVWRGEVG